MSNLIRVNNKIGREEQKADDELEEEIVDIDQSLAEDKPGICNEFQHPLRQSINLY